MLIKYLLKPWELGLCIYDKICQELWDVTRMDLQNTLQSKHLQVAVTLSNFLADPFSFSYFDFHRQRQSGLDADFSGTHYSGPYTKVSSEMSCHS